MCVKANVSSTRGIKFCILKSPTPIRSSTLFSKFVVRVSNSRCLAEMKASLMLTLFALCLTTGAAELPHLGNALSFLKHRSVLTAGLDPKERHISNPDSKQNTSHFYQVIEYGYKRNGKYSITHTGVSIEQCIKYCRKSDSCLAVDYYHPYSYCYELQTWNSFSTDSSYATCLVKTKDGDDPCNDVYAHKGRYIPNYFYKIFENEQTPTSKDCCGKCREDPESRCKAWTYHIANKWCYLFDVTPPRTTSSSYTSGYAAVD